MAHLIKDVEIYTENGKYFSGKEGDYSVSLTGVLRFKDDEGRQIQTNFKYYIQTKTSLSCGHEVSNYYEEDGGNAGTFPNCKECDKKSG